MSDDGTKTEVTPPITIRPLGKIESIKGKSLLVSGEGMNFTVWFGNHDAKPDHMSSYLHGESDGLTTVDTSQVHVYEKDLPKKPKPKDLQGLSTVSGNVAHMQYFRKVGKLSRNRLLLLEDRLDVFDHGSQKVIEFFKGFASLIKKK